MKIKKKLLLSLKPDIGHNLYVYRLLNLSSNKSTKRIRFETYRRLTPLANNISYNYWQRSAVIKYMFRKLQIHKFADWYIKFVRLADFLQMWHFCDFFGLLTQSLLLGLFWDRVLLGLFRDRVHFPFFGSVANWYHKNLWICNLRISHTKFANF